MNEKELPVTTPADDGIRISKEDFSKLSFRQKFAVTEYGYLLSLEDAEVVGKMLGGIGKEKDVLPFCQAKGKKVISFEKSTNSTSTFTNIHLLIGLFVGVIIGLIYHIFSLVVFRFSILLYTIWFGFVGITFGIIGAYIGRKSKRNSWIAATIFAILGASLLFVLLASLCAWCM